MPRISLKSLIVLSLILGAGLWLVVNAYVSSSRSNRATAIFNTINMICDTECRKMIPSLPNLDAIGEHSMTEDGKTKVYIWRVRGEGTMFLHFSIDISRDGADILVRGDSEPNARLRVLALTIHEKLIRTELPLRWNATLDSRPFPDIK